jgi:hypothetical protein
MDQGSPDETLPCATVEDDEPTERIALQRCPTCDGVTAVTLCVAVTHCEICGHALDVAPLAS